MHINKLYQQRVLFIWISQAVD